MILPSYKIVENFRDVIKLFGPIVTITEMLQVAIPLIHKITDHICYPFQELICEIFSWCHVDFEELKVLNFSGPVEEARNVGREKRFGNWKVQDTRMSK